MSGPTLKKGTDVRLHPLGVAIDRCLPGWVNSCIQKKQDEIQIKVVGGVAKSAKGASVIVAIAHESSVHKSILTDALAWHFKIKIDNLISPGGEKVLFNRSTGKLEVLEMSSSSLENRGLPVQLAEAIRDEVRKSLIELFSNAGRAKR